MYKYLVLAIIAPFCLSGCKSPFELQNRYDNWISIADVKGIEVYIDTTSIKQMGAVTYAFEKRVYVTPEAKEAQVERIRNEYIKLGNPEKANKWNDFSYSVYYNLYDCTNRRFKVLIAEDYDSNGNRIVRTVTSKDKLRWLNVNSDTVGDYTFFFVCDYGK